MILFHDWSPFLHEKPFFPILSCPQLISIRSVYIICSWKIYLLVFVHYSSMNSIKNLNGNFPFFFLLLKYIHLYIFQLLIKHSLIWKI